MNTRATTGLLLVAALTAGPAMADDLTGVDQFLCTAVEASVCDVDGECVVGAPWKWNIPQFIEIDLAGKMLGTTKASAENRVTPILHLSREEGVIYLQGVEGGRAFSFVIVEESGMATVAVAREGITVGVFGYCTPRTK
jgi:hypothetical protein